MVDYYDLVLAGIPVLFAGLLGVSTLAGAALVTSIVVATIPVFGLMGHAMFVVPIGVENEAISEETQNEVPALASN